ncbi:hypothetical protein OKS35_06750 [Exiguobacterium sp. N5]|uniref:hypothetical protein n=1 Tax=Exiguobacterium sp. N5 TaxID=2990450 RepID=UPI0021F3E00D|nr:hypothetical protein [Exiguobacterium sp. N5]MCV9899820.1 hypothetical protein [Exiguobacterium sp. N5]
MRFITLDESNIVVSVRYGNDVLSGEIESEVGNVGQRYVDGEFIDVPIEPQMPIETMEEKITRLEQLVQEQNLVQMEVLATIYEEILGGA